MIKPIMKSEFFLRLPSEDAGPDDAATGQDLLDTLHEHEHECVGLAANMIGVRKRIICVKDGNRTLLMYNPQILEQVNAYQTSEGCLSLIGERPCTRYRRIKVEYLDENFVHRIKNFSGYTAEIIQHEIDHCNGDCYLVPPIYRTADHLTLRELHSRQSDVQFQGRDQKVSALSFHVTVA